MWASADIWLSLKLKQLLEESLAASVTMGGFHHFRVQKSLEFS